MKSKKAQILAGVVCLVLTLIAAREFLIHEERSELDMKVRDAKFDRESAKLDLDMAKMTGDTRRVEQLQARADEANREFERLKGENTENGKNSTPSLRHVTAKVS